MKILIVGGGGREHALAWKIARSPRVGKIWAAPGNAGIASVAECLPIAAEDVDALLVFARRERPDLTVVGPEQPLLAGMTDRLEAAGLRVFGPCARAAKIEGSKAFAKRLMKEHGIPSGDFETFEDPDEAVAYVRRQGAPIVVKADGLAAGKGVVVAASVEEAEDAVRKIMIARVHGESGRRVVIEEYLEGEELSFLAFTDGRTCLPLASSQDHKRLLDGDRGPNTGGMGAYSPAPVLTPEIEKTAMDRVVCALIEALRAEGITYRGVIYAGLMVKDGDVRVLEFNARFGDPETQPLLVRMQGDLVPVLDAVAAGDLSGARLAWDPRPAVCVVMAAAGYPETPAKGAVIEGLADAGALEDVVVFHAGTKREGDRIVVSGGRVLSVTARGKDLAAAQARAYEAVARIRFEGGQFRRDIAHRALRGPGARGI
ncbi:MAG: phosphoribosylamine--glycine ligase [Deltaproteobacteria bacterium RBG_13_65_10]|nr:MAG: phosphoribosylamine--glycine ligase [Deltaproteobacteria bacterium RBG_13_65_10]